MKRLGLVVATVVVSIANADVIAPAEAACRGSKPGTACRAETGAGVCVQAKCSKNDYSQGIPPRQKLVDCLTCQAPSRDAGTGQPRR